LTNKRSDRLANKSIKDDDLDRLSTKEKSTHERIDSVKTNVNSFSNDIIGDEVDQISEIITTKSTSHHREKELTKDNFLQNELKENSSDSVQSKQNPGSAVEKTSNNPSSQIIPDAYSNNEF
jgi:hypothetical protein